MRTNNEGGSQIYTPPGWPRQVLPPGAPDWERSASTYLFDCCPADYRAYPVLRRHPVVLARLASEFVDSQLAAGGRALATARTSLQGCVDLPVLDQCVDAISAEQARLTRTKRSVGLVEAALRGQEFRRKL